MGFPGPQNGTATPVPGPHLWRPHLWNDTDFPVCTEHTGFRTPRRQSDIGLPAPNSSPPVRPSGTARPDDTGRCCCPGQQPQSAIEARFGHFLVSDTTFQAHIAREDRHFGRTAPASTAPHCFFSASSGGRLDHTWPPDRRSPQRVGRGVGQLPAAALPQSLLPVVPVVTPLGSPCSAQA